jgi:hypothetical protein
MPGTRWIKVQATIVECSRAGEERPAAAHPWYEIVADIKTPAGKVKRVSSRQKLNTLTHHWRAPEPGDVVSARWDQAHRDVRLNLRRDPRYDERVIRALGRTRDVPPGSPNQTGTSAGS